MKFKKIEFEKVKNNKWFGVGYLEEYTIIKNGSVFEIYSSKSLTWGNGKTFEEAVEVCQEYNNEKLQDVLDRWFVWEDLNE